jgi:hypothetical protein
MIFRKAAKPGPAVAAIDAFWRWWAGARPRAEADLADVAVADEMSRRVSAINPGLDWEFSPGTGSRHLLVVSPAGNSALRSLTERWRRAGPPDDQTFAYAAARQGRPSALDGYLDLPSGRVDLSALRFAAEPDSATGVVHVQIWHPDFPSLPEQARTTVKFLALDWLLGEDTVEIWIGEIAEAAGPGPTLTGAELAALVAARMPADGKLHWRNLTGSRRGKPLMAAAQTPLRAATHPAHDLHVRIDVPYTDRRRNGWPAQPALDELHALEDHIVRGADSAVLVAHEMCDGRWTDHLYADRPASADALRPLVAGWPHGRVRIKITPDPSWAAVAHLG